ncbi:polyphosphate polymerase domain-containing protein [Ruminococcus sp.]|uniref:polyphosphate polymerase domain-containing protein n=1 Tax=Ruminococcus sp. TaxID=41978 RepID=UPI0025EFDFD0|nr:polyphosphate polymerase domain-containing protein [Ruminococcus sp.]
MNAYQEVFKRIEKKYILDEPTYEKLIKRLEKHFVSDKYGKSTVCNIYFDTPSHLLVRNSIEKPVYKEKLRVRSYGVPNDDSMVFVELKKKYKGVVYKRRIEMSLEQSRDFIAGREIPHKNVQIENELKYFLKFYEGIAPAMYLSYDRIALCGIENPALRVTFDTHILYREEQLELDKGIWGKELLPIGTRIMEIKIPGVMPMWLSEILDELKIFPASYSKYGTAYLNELSEKINKGKVTSCA